MIYQYRKKSFDSKMAIYNYLTSSEIISCSYNFFIKALKISNRNIKETLNYIKKYYKGGIKTRSGFEIDGLYYNNMSEFEDRFNLPKNTLSNLKSKYKLTAKKAAIRALKSPIARAQMLHKKELVSKFLQLKLPTTNFIG